MAPRKAKNPKTSGDSDILTRPQLVQTKSPARTPVQNPRKKIGGLTAAQKQALMDNLQLEVTERARKLRAQYALQAQSLRTRVEMRVNRIPTALRKANMGELFEKYVQLSQAKPAAEEPPPAQLSDKQTATPHEATADRPQIARSNTAPLQRAVRKRASDEMSVADDKENIASDKALPNPKKRAKPNKKANIDNNTTVLSPKSANARNLPRLQPQQHEEGGKVPFLQDITATNPSQQHTSPSKLGLSPSRLGANTTAATSLLSSMLSPTRITAPVSANFPATLASDKPAKQPAAPRGRPPTATATGAPQSRPPTRAKAGARTTRKQDARVTSNTSTLSTTSMGTTIVSQNTKKPNARAGTTAAARAAPVSSATGRKNVTASKTTSSTATTTKSTETTAVNKGARKPVTANGGEAKGGRRVLRKR